MASKTSRCARCSSACELKTLPPVSGQDGTLKLTLLEMPAMVCSKGHKAPVERDFMLWLIQELRQYSEQLAAGREEGLLFKKHLCGACGKDLGAKPERTETFSRELKYQDLAPFRAQIEEPLYKCTACGKEQLRSAKDVQRQVPRAIMGVNDAAGFPHSG